MRARIFVCAWASLGVWVACGGTGAVQDGDVPDGSAGQYAAGTSGGAGAAGKGGGAAAGKGGGAGASAGAGGNAGAAGTAGAAAGSSGAAGSGGAAGSAGSGAASGAAGAGACAKDTADCNGKPEDKCETHTDVDIANCGACGSKCPAAPANATAKCTASKCGTECQPGYSDCDGNAANGCETATGTDVNNCGTCMNKCTAGAGATPACSGGKCVLGCPVGMGDCNQVPADGCEATLANDPKNCGLCGMTCGGAACVNGACQCAGETQTAKKVPLDMYIMMDQSSSMGESTSGGGTKWDAVKQALAGFVADPKAAGIGVGIGFFAVPPGGGGGPPSSCKTNADCVVGTTDFGPCFSPLPGIIPGICFNASTGSDSCNAADYAKPEVEIAPLPGVASAINGAMGAHSPTSSTPTGPALQGAVDHAKAWATAHPDHVVVAVLATDGDPSECNPGDIPGIANIAATALAGSPKIRTFVIGVGSSTANLDAIAKGGGTAPAFIVDTNQNVVQQFEAALEAIQGTALACQYGIPKPQSGTLDYGKVNVQYTPGSGSAVVIGNVANAAACDPSKGGWYYDVPAAPTQILLCPATCTTVSADKAGTVAIQLGCTTQKN